MPKKQKSGLYRTKVKIGVDANGKDVVKYVSGRTKAELEEAKREVVNYYIRGTGLTSDRLFGEYAAEWYRVVKAPLVSPSSREAYRTALNAHILPVFGERNLRSITPMEIQSFVNRFAGCSQTKITMIFATLNGIFNSACTDRIIPENPARNVRKPSATPPKEKIALTADERARIEEVCASHPYGHYLALMYYLGVRPGEARGLQWGDIDWKRRVIHIQRDVDYKEQGRVGALKTDKSNRVIPMPDALCAILRPLRGMPEVFITHGEKGGALAKTSAERIWLRLMEACGLAAPLDPDSTCYPENDVRAQYAPLITPHALRHNYITVCYENGIDPYTTMRLVGHKSIKTTMDIYTHLSDAQLDKMAVKVDDMFQKKSCTKVAQAQSQDADGK